MLLLVSSSTKAAPFQQIEDPQGMVWFIGTVEQITDGIPAIDLGEVHTLRTPGEARPFAVELGGAGAKRVEELPPGCRVVVVRNRNNRFSPLGLMNVHFTHPTWSEMEKPTSFSPEVGDIVMFVGAPGELGSGATIRDSFIRHRIVANSNRNRYSTMRESIKANALQGIIEKQPTWVKGQRRIAGVIRSVSVTKDSYVRLKPFINQIMMFQDYQDQGVHVSQVTTGAWQGVPERSLQVCLSSKRKYRGNTGGLARELAADLKQDGVAFLVPFPGSIWRVVAPDGAIIATGSLTDFPITC